MECETGFILWIVVPTVAYIGFALGHHFGQESANG